MSMLAILIIIGMTATALVLAVGLVGFWQGGEFNRKYGNLMMRLRVLCQGVTLALIALFLMTH